MENNKTQPQQPKIPTLEEQKTELEMHIKNYTNKINKLQEETEEIGNTIRDYYAWKEVTSQHLKFVTDKLLEQNKNKIPATTEETQKN